MQLHLGLSTCPAEVSKDTTCIAMDGHSNVIYNTTKGRTEKSCGSKLNLWIYSFAIERDLSQPQPQLAVADCR